MIQYSNLDREMGTGDHFKSGTKILFFVFIFCFSACRPMLIMGQTNQRVMLQFEKKLKNENIKFWYEQNENNKYLKLLRSKFPIDSIVKDAQTDMDKTLKILNWVYCQWQHDGNNQPRRNDAISILEKAQKGKNFRCVEYGIVVAACSNAIGLKARVLGLKTKDVETTQFGAGHVVTEVFLNDLKKWVFVDGQYDAMPVLNDIPLNAVEFQKAIVENYDQLVILSSKITKEQYTDWIYRYLHYFDISFDNREGIRKKQTSDGKRFLMLVPLGAKRPTVFQIKYPIANVRYTHSLEDFYLPPYK